MYGNITLAAEYLAAEYRVVKTGIMTDTSVALGIFLTRRIVSPEAFHIVSEY
jgi:hypothetical protein